MARDEEVGSPEHVRRLYLEPETEWGRSRIERVLGALEPRPHDRILDLGCANGTFAYHAARAGALAVGVDRDAGVLVRGRAAMFLAGGPPPRLRLVAADARRLPFRDRVFTKVVSADFLEHLGDAPKRAAVGEAARVVLPGGPVVLYTPSRTRVEWEVRGERWKHRLGLRPKNGPPPASWRDVVDPDHFGEASCAEVEDLARGAGLSVEATHLFEVHVPGVSRMPVAGRLLEAVPSVRRTFGNRILVVARRPRPADRRRGRRTAALALVAAAAAAAVGLAHLDRHPVGGDEGVYIDLARNVAAGAGYVSTIGPGARPEAHYPPLLPALLAPVAAVRDDLVAYRLVALAAGAAAAAACAVYLRSALGAGAAALLASLAFAVHPALAGYATEAITEAPMVLLALACVVALEAHRRRGGPVPLVVAVAAAAAAFHLRTAAVALVATVPAYVLLVRGVRPAVASAALLAALSAPWTIRAAALGYGEGYVRGHLLQIDIYDSSKGEAGPADIARRIGYNAAVYAGRIAAEAIVPPLGVLAPRDPRKVLASLAVTTIFLAGAARAARQRSDAADLFAGAHLALCLLHPVYAPRYLFPVLPVIVRHIASWGAPAAAVLLAVSVAGLALEDRTMPPAWTGYMEAVEWIAREADEGDVVMGRRPETVRIHAGRRAVSYPGTADPAALAASIARQGVRYVIVDDFRIGIRSADAYLKPAMAGLPGRFRHMFTARTDPNVHVYEVVR